ncbi:hypothetical protein NP233_g7260 [Leucocoprinus birnbaumii]|uniref:Uncharacterized protein n=1 Tax=Leucocoprinus birnbaumii TaxID=56174 RepID=A0AAD5YQ62_9AGAR|nr:hypothetical protein NP233_g7260 [Leucocoprinus birnbaumii]
MSRRDEVQTLIILTIKSSGPTMDKFDIKNSSCSAYNQVYGIRTKSLWSNWRAFKILPNEGFRRLLCEIHEIIGSFDDSAAPLQRLEAAEKDESRYDVYPSTELMGGRSLGSAFEDGLDNFKTSRWVSAALRYAAAVLATNPEKTSKARGEYLRTHFKNMREVAAALTGMKLTKAYTYLSDVKDHNRVIPFRRFSGGVGRTAQAKEFKTTQGAWRLDV